jgi:RNA polymerase sigma-70 factor, ECF subfamily
MDANEFKMEVLPLKNKLYRFASRMLDDTEEACDAVQEVFIRLWNIRDKLQELNSLEAFAMTVTKNYCLDRIKARRTVSVEQTRSLLFEEDENENIEKLTEQRDTIRHLRQIMNQLPEQQRMIIQLRDIEGYEYEEIEQALDINLNTIRVNLSRARKKLRDLYFNRITNGPEKNKSFTG